MRKFLAVAAGTAVLFIGSTLMPNAASAAPAHAAQAAKSGPVWCC